MRASSRSVELHPAVAGWRALAGTSARPIAIEAIARGPKSAVYRLCGAGPRGTSVVAKAQSREGLRIERAVYERVLPRLPGATLRSYGAIEMADGWCWIFLEDAGGRAYSPASLADRTLAARWLADMHAATAVLKPPPMLRRKGLQRYREVVARVTRILTALSGRGWLTALDRRSIGGILRHLERLDSNWPELEDRARSMPCALTHGDFSVRNLRVRRVRGVPELAVFDWDMAAWGVCVVDLAQWTVDSATPAIHAYWRTIRRTFPQIDAAAVRSAARTGAVLRLIAALDWELAKSNPLREPWALNNLRPYHTLMREMSSRNGR